MTSEKPSERIEHLQNIMNSGMVGKEQEFNVTAFSSSMQDSSPSSSSPQEVSQAKNVQEIPLYLLLDNPYQPRAEISIDQELREMAEGIEKYGLLGALPARKHPQREGFYQLGFGHRRREASKLAKKETMPIVVEELDDAAMAGLAVLENVQRVDLTPMELGRLFRHLKSEGYTQEDIATLIKKDRSYVITRLRAAEAPRDIQALIEEKPSCLRAVHHLVKIKYWGDRAPFIQGLKEGTLTVKDLEDSLEQILEALQEPGVSQEMKTLRSEQAATPSITSSQEEEQEEVRQLAEDMRNPLLSPQLFALRESRLGAAKLRKVLRYLEAYMATLMERTEGISVKEQKLLHQIVEKLETLCESSQTPEQSA